MIELPPLSLGLSYAALPKILPPIVTKMFSSIPRGVRMNTTMILHVDHKHFVVLLALFDRGAIILDLGIGRSFCSIPHLMERWHSVLLRLNRRANV